MSTKQKVGTNAWAKMQRKILDARVKRTDPPILDLHYRNIVSPEGLIDLWPKEVREQMAVVQQTLCGFNTCDYPVYAEPQVLRGIVINNRGV